MAGAAEREGDGAFFGWSKDEGEMKMGVKETKGKEMGATERMWAALETKAERTVEEALKSGADANKAKDRDGRTPLMTAARYGMAGTVGLLLKWGADARAQDQTRTTALDFAIDSGSHEALVALLDAGAAANGVETRGFGIGPKMSPLAFAAGLGHVDQMATLLDRGARINEARGMSKKTPLHDAASAGHEEAGLLLLERGAAPDLEDENGLTPLMIAALNGMVGLCKGLLKAGASASRTGYAGNAVLHYAVEGGSEDVVGMLLAAEAPLDGINFDGLSPLGLAAKEESRTGLLELMVEAGCNANEGAGGKCSWTPPLIAAAERGNAAGVGFLLGLGVSLETRGKNGDTALMAACSWSTDRCARMLFEAGADVNAKAKDDGNKGMTPLMRAAGLDGSLAMDMVNAGARVNARDSHGWTPLHFAATHGRADLVALLLAKGADPDALDNDEMAPLESAVDDDFAEVMGALVEEVRLAGSVKRGRRKENKVVGKGLGSL